MKRLLNRSFILLALLGVLFTSCKKDHYDEPPIQDLPIGQVYTIDQILALESGFVFNEDASVYGTITADEVSGNLYKAAFLQDPETGKAIELYLNATSGVRIGDRVRITGDQRVFRVSFVSLPMGQDWEMEARQA